MPRITEVPLWSIVQVGKLPLPPPRQNVIKGSASRRGAPVAGHFRLGAPPKAWRRVAHRLAVRQNP